MEFFKKIFIRVISVGIAVFVGIQLIPVKRTLPNVSMNVDADEETHMILRRACYTCHSNETTWPWYGYIAPVSWMVVRNVNIGRERLNFSEWDTYGQWQQEYLIGEAIAKLEKGEMPPWEYRILHPKSNITENELTIVKKWARSKGALE
ncbi:MAG: heme-binding domain-containing protein [bacterium]|nr:heme-binding domain-containing protein [bacterium]